MNKAIFLDRDGTINEMVYNEILKIYDSPFKIEDFKLLSGVVEGLKILKNLGYLLIVVTNQPAAAKGKTSYDNLYNINNYLKKILEEDGVIIDDIFMCNHQQSDNCICRKPRIGLFEQAVKKYDIDIKQSYMVGDRSTDIKAGNIMGLNSIFIGGPYGIHNRMGGIYYSIFDSVYSFALNLQKEVI